MDVRCERCRAQYVFDDEQVTPAGLAVQCTNCGHLFKVKKKELVVTVPVKPDELHGSPVPATAAAPRGGPAAADLPHDAERQREWRVRQANGNIFTFRELTTLQKWIIERKVSRDDEISLAGEQWKRLGNIAELASFFQVVEAAERGRAQAPFPPVVTPLPGPELPAFGVGVQTPGLRPPPPPPSGYPPPSFAVPPKPRASPPPAPPPEPPPELDLPPEADLDAEEIAAVKKGRGARLFLALVLLLAAAAGATYFLAPEVFVLERRPPPPESLEVPITIEVKPAAPAAPPAGEPAPAGPGPALGTTIGEPTVSLAPVPAPEPVPQAPVPPPPEPIAAPAPEAKPPPPAPRGPKALLAQATRLREKGDVERALELYGRVVAQEPENVEALTGRGLCYLDLESYPPAEASFQAALRIEPEEADALLGLAETYRWQGRKTDAIKYYDRYLAAHPAGEEAEVARNALKELRE